jgi:hypothetical protein
MRAFIVVLLAGCAESSGPATDHLDRVASAPLHEAQAHEGRPHVRKPPRPPRACKQDQGHGKGQAKKPACALIGTDGGRVTLDSGPTLDIPPGALLGDTEITISTSPSPAPAGALTPRFTFGPAGTVFDVPVAITLPVPAGTAGASLYWSKVGGAGFDNLGGTITGTSLRASVVHFSDGFVAPDAGNRVIALTLANKHYVDGVAEPPPNDATYPSLTAYDPVFYLPDGAGGLALPPQQPTPTQIGNGTYQFALPPGTTYYEVDVKDPAYQPYHLIYATSDDSIDIGTDSNDRAEAAALVPPSEIDLHIASLTWTPGDQLWAFSPEESVDYADLEQVYAIAGGAPFDLSLTSTDADNPVQIRGSLGDRFLVAHLTQSGGTVAQTELLVSTIEQDDQGDARTVTGSFGGAPHSTTLAIDGSQFATLIGLDPVTDDITNLSIGPAMADDQGWILTAAAPYDCPYTGCATYNAPLHGGLTSQGVSYVTAGSTITDGTQSAELIAFASITAAGATTPANAFMNVLAIGSGTIVPLVGPVTNVMAGTQPLDVPQVLTMSSPTITWDAPPLLIPDTTPPIARHYTVRLDHISNVGGATHLQVIGYFSTTTTSVTIPAELLTSGEQYDVRIRADANVYLQRNARTPYGVTPHFSALFTAP